MCVTQKVLLSEEITSCKDISRPRTDMHLRTLVYSQFQRSKLILVIPRLGCEAMTEINFYIHQLTQIP